MKGLWLLFCIIVVVSGKVYKKKPTVDPYANFLDDKELVIPEEDDDKPPNDFKGDVMQAKITNAVNRNYGKGKFKNTFETQNGIQISQVGKLKDNKTFVVMGSYSYTGADGKRYRVKYTADEFGYHPITELEVDIPELVFPEPTKRPPISSIFSKIEFNKSSKQPGTDGSLINGGNAGKGEFHSNGKRGNGGIDGQVGNLYGGQGGIGNSGIGSQGGNRNGGSNGPTVFGNNGFGGQGENGGFQGANGSGAFGANRNRGKGGIGQLYLPPKTSIIKENIVPEADNIYLPPKHTPSSTPTHTQIVSTKSVKNPNTINKSNVYLPPNSTHKTIERKNIIPEAENIFLPPYQTIEIKPTLKTTQAPTTTSITRRTVATNYVPPIEYLPPVGLKSSKRS